MAKCFPKKLNKSIFTETKKNNIMRNFQLEGNWKSTTTNDILTFEKVNAEYYHLTINDEILEAGLSINNNRQQDHKIYEIIDNEDLRIFKVRSNHFNTMPSIFVYDDYLSFNAYDNYNDIMKKISELKFTKK